MKRRDFLRNAALAGGGVTFVARQDRSAIAARSDQETETIVVNGLDPSVLSEDYLGMQRAAGVNCWHVSMGDLRSFSDAHNFVDAHRQDITVVRTVREIRQAKRDGKLGLLFGWQSADPLSGPRNGENDWWSETSRTNLRGYYELGLRICGIAYQIVNAFGGGGVEGQIGLTRAGRRLVEEIHKLRIVLDIGGHTGDQTSIDALAMSSGVPVICSHANARALANSTRNLSDRLIEGIARSGGVIGIVAISDFVMRGKEMAQVEPSPLGTVDDMVKHADHIKKIAGARHVGLGPDFTHGMSLTRDYVLFGPDVLDKGPRRYVKGFETITELPNVVATLQRHAWTEAEIRGFLGGNWLRVYEQVWGT